MIKHIVLYIFPEECDKTSKDLHALGHLFKWYRHCFTAKNATDLLQIVDFTSLLQVVNTLQNICWIYQHRMKNHICTHIGTRCQNANAANATHLLWCEFMSKCFKQCQLKDIRWLMCRYFTTLRMILSLNHGLTKMIFKQSIHAF